jgi:hypothetical protein
VCIFTQIPLIRLHGLELRHPDNFVFIFTLTSSLQGKLLTTSHVNLFCISQDQFYSTLFHLLTDFWQSVTGTHSASLRSWTLKRASLILFSKSAHRTQYTCTWHKI